MVVLAVNSILLEGAGEGLRFYLLPDFDRMTELGIGNVLLGAMTQAFLTLSLGIGAMAIWRNYIGFPVVWIYSDGHGKKPVLPMSS